MADSEDIIGFIRHAETLKRVFRSGWSLAGVNSVRPESVAEHVYGSIIISIAVSRYLEGQNLLLNMEKTLIMAAIHDLAESFVSDIPRITDLADSSLLADMKRRVESAAIHEMLSHPIIGSDSMLAIWEEYVNGSTLEARAVRGADIIDMLMHALNLEDSGISPKILDQFFISSHKVVESLEIDAINDIFRVLLNKHERNSERWDCRHKF